MRPSFQSSSSASGRGLLRPDSGDAVALSDSLLDAQRRLLALENEHKFALQMLETSCTHLRDVLQENRALRMQNQYLKDTFSQIQGSAPFPAAQEIGAVLRAEQHAASSRIPGLLGSDYAMLGSATFPISSAAEAGFASGEEQAASRCLHGRRSQMPRSLRSQQASLAGFLQEERTPEPSEAELMSLLAFAQRAASSQRLNQSEPPLSDRGSVYLDLLHAAGAGQGTSTLPSACDLSEQRPADGDVRQTSLASAVGKDQMAAAVSQQQSTTRRPSKESSAGSSRKSFEHWMTTIVVRNIPARYTQERLLEVWEPDGSYNFLYLPYSVRQKRGAGYVFINFCAHELAVAFWHRVQGTRLPGCEHLKSLDVAAADVQGLEDNLRYWGSRKLGRISNANFLPIVLDGIQRLDFKHHVAAFSGASVRIPSGQDYDEDDDLAAIALQSDLRTQMDYAISHG
eukprot:gb/GFBE01036523.1/.p1 GENE.gb/GFBE01036523.1/~~gb/GFBE01036523.1/.p1  ORF type:complete len:456 (+),score=67.24 gb/GFBE01036523.1/:1-1368(+)